MPISLGLRDSRLNDGLPRRLLWLNAVRLVVLLILLGLVAYGFVRNRPGLGTESMQVVLVTLAGSFAAAGLVAFLVRRGSHIGLVAEAQLVFDQLSWTMLVYLSGGVSSGATSFYGLTCLAGAIAIGLRGAAVAASAALVFYGTLVVAFWRGWLAGPSDQAPELYRYGSEELLYHLAVNSLGIVVVALLAGYLAERLRLTGGQLVAAEARAERAERMAALGRLSAGLAHEIRNPLGSISGSIQLLATGKGLSSEDRQLCCIIQRETVRLNDLVTDMLDLTRPRQRDPMPVDVVGVARDVLTLATGSGRAVSDVKIHLTADQGPLMVLADAGQLRQMLWNLVKNAVQASSAGDSVEVTVGLVDRRVVLAVQDEGIGIDAEARERMFDPFFTTRSHGTGVGLAVVKRIVDEHGFQISVMEGRKRGARFAVDAGPPMLPSQVTRTCDVGQQV
jgi:two-component system, NtrC family, sensor histidine kinase HydH